MISASELDAELGVGPHPEPWPDDDRLDPELLAAGDRRNVVDRYRYWRMEAIVADLDRRRHPFHVAIENWEHDRNIGTIVRTANAFLAAEVHIVGQRRWNRRGAMVTEQYQHLRHHATIDDLVGVGGRRRGLPIVGVDIVPGAVPARGGRAARSVRAAVRPGGAGSVARGPRAAAGVVVSIRQFGSTRSLNAGVAAGHRDARRGCVRWVRPDPDR